MARKGLMVYPDGLHSVPARSAPRAKPCRERLDFSKLDHRTWPAMCAYMEGDAYMNICACLHIYVHIYLFIYVCAYALHIYAYICIYSYIASCIRFYISMCCTRGNMCKERRTHIQTSTHICICI